MKKFLIAVMVMIMVVSLFSTNVLAASFYSGVNRSGNFTGISASIKAPSSYPVIGTSGESCWITTQAETPSGRTWVQTGLRYWDGFTVMKTYFEYKYPPTGDYDLIHIGTHLKGATVAYKLQYNSSNVVWDAYIGGSKIGSYNNARTYANVQAQGESHDKTQVQLGPFVFSDVKMRLNGSSSYTNNTTKAPTANAPYTFTVHNNYYKYTV